jgi:hypothetical protein
MTSAVTTNFGFDCNFGCDDTFGCDCTSAVTTPSVVTTTSAVIPPFGCHSAAQRRNLLLSLLFACSLVVIPAGNLRLPLPSGTQGFALRNPRLCLLEPQGFALRNPRLCLQVPQGFSLGSLSPSKNGGFSPWGMHSSPRPRVPPKSTKKICAFPTTKMRSAPLQPNHAYHHKPTSNLTTKSPVENAISPNKHATPTTPK